MRRQQGGQPRRWWRRLERRAITAHERDLLAALKQLAEDCASCLVVAEEADNPAGILRLFVSQQQLLLAGVLPAHRRELRAMQAGAPLQLTAGGRYGPLWWITLSNGSTHSVIAGSRLRLRGESGGSGLIAAAKGLPPKAQPLPELCT